jgi:hypothetical protein
MKSAAPLVQDGIAYSYIRCSAPQQNKGGAKVRQSSGAEDYATTNHLRSSPEGYEDLGISAFRGSNT